MPETQDIIIYRVEGGSQEIAVKLARENIWLTQKQIEQLFDSSKANISEHISHIFQDGELTKEATVRKFRTVQQEGSRQVSREREFYNLDMIIAVGYRVNSKRATQFRIWATRVLKQYLTQGYALNRQLLQEQKAKMHSLQQAIGLLSRVALEDSAHTAPAARVLEEFATGLALLDDYDHNHLDDQGRSLRPAAVIPPQEFLSIIQAMKPAFASEVFAKPKDASFESSVRQIYQSFNGQELYPSIEQKAAELLYLIVKNHSFADGNKRIAAACFLYFLQKNNALFRADGAPVIENKALAALTLLIALSTPAEKETILRITLSILNRK